MWLASSSPYHTFYPLSCLFCDWLVANHLACYKSHLSLSRFSTGIVWLDSAREENNTIRLCQKHYSNMESKAPFNKEFTLTTISEEMLLLQSNAHTEPWNNVCGKREVELGCLSAKGGPMPFSAHGLNSVIYRHFLQLVHKPSCQRFTSFNNQSTIFVLIKLKTVLLKNFFCNYFLQAWQLLGACQNEIN